MGCVSSKSAPTSQKPIQQNEEIVEYKHSEPPIEVKAEKPAAASPQKNETLEDLKIQKIKQQIQLDSQVEIIEFSGLTLKLPEKITCEKQFSILTSGQLIQWLIYLEDVNEIETLLSKLKIKTPYQQWKITQLYTQQIKQIQTTILKTDKKYTLLTQIFNKLKDNFDDILNDLLIGTTNQINKSSPLACLLLLIKTYHIIGCTKGNQQHNKAIIKNVSTLINSIQDMREIIEQEYEFIVDLKTKKNNIKNQVQPFLEDFYNNTFEKINDQNYNHKDFSKNYLDGLYTNILNKIDEQMCNVQDDYEDIQSQNLNKYESYKIFLNKRGL